MRAIRATTLAALTIGLGGLGAARSHDGHDHAGPHGGAMAKSGTQQYEIVFAKSGLKLYPLTAGGKPVDTSRLTGTATFYRPNSSQPWFQKPLRPDAAPGQVPTSLNLDADLSTVPASGAKVAFEVNGLADQGAFTVPFTLAAPASGITVAKATRAERAVIAAQKVCPVSHEDLMSMGGPLKVSRGNQSVLVCCQGCVKDIKANPDKFFTGANGSADAGTHDH